VGKIGVGKIGLGNGKRVVNSPEPYAHTRASPLGDPARSSAKRPVHPEYVPFVLKSVWVLGNGVMNGK
jgi:hypothetical protein